ncbi:MAG: ATP-binding cassette domain-containing protein [Deltaproteobacteria bacterium]|nr:ATP-binding cassette domain-containing protein [Deltaproteobacteria bacterium]
MIQVRGLTKYYGDRTAVDHIDFHVKEGEILGFLGPNGAGKTTTMRMITGFLSPDEGEVVVCGYSVVKNPYDVKKNLGYLPETPPIYEEYLVAPYLEHICRLKGVPKKQRKGAVDVALQKTGLTHVRNRLIGNLSRGYKQRVGLAQALVHDPKVLILDEPTVGLDPNQIREIRELIKGLGGSHTVILSTHILPEVSVVCDRIVIINEGKIAAVDTYENLSATLRKSESIELLLKKKDDGVKNKIGELKGVKSVQEKNEYLIIESELNTDIRENVAKLVVESGWGLLEMKPIHLSLEDVFVKLTLEE